MSFLLQIKIMSSHLDTHIGPGLTGYGITISPKPPGYDEGEIEKLVQWHKEVSDHCYLIVEDRTDGTDHFHSAITCRSKRTSNVTRSLLLFMDKEGLEYVRNVTVRIKHIDDLPGWLSYCQKDQKGRKPLLVRGWKISWIKKQATAFVKSRPVKVGRVRVVRAAEAASLVIDYAKAQGLPITGLEQFLEVIARMTKDNYCFSGIKRKCVYGDVMCLCGDDRPVKALWRADCSELY